MAVTKVIKIDDKDVTFRASAATPRIYRNLFGRDIFKDLSKLEKDIDKNGEENLDMFSLEMFDLNTALLLIQSAHSLAMAFCVISLRSFTSNSEPYRLRSRSCLGI